MDLYKKYNSHLQHFHTDSDKKEREGFTKRWPTFYQKFLPTNKKIRILDLGCGLGHWLYLIQKLGYTNFLGIDVVPENISHVQKYITPKVIQSNAFEHLSQNIEQYDFIHLKDVIEHIPQDRLVEFTTKLYQALKPGGKVMISTANATHPLGRFARYADITHTLGAFTETSLRQILVAANFDHIQLVATNLPFGKTSLLGFLKRILYLAPSHLLAKIYYKLEGIRPTPRVYHWHITAIASKESNE